MTRRGSLAYYLAAIVVGCLFTSGIVWLASRYSLHPREGPFLAFYVAGLATGSVMAATGAFLLRFLCRWLGLQKVWQWMLLGMAVGPATVWVFRGLAAPLDSPGWLWLAGVVIGGGAGVIVDYGIWLVVPSGALTACVLYLVDRAFSG